MRETRKAARNEAVREWTCFYVSQVRSCLTASSNAIAFGNRKD